MGTRLLIVLVVIIVLLAVLAVVLGANRKPPADEETDVKKGNTGMAPLLERTFGWMAPHFDLADLTVEGADLDREKRTLTLQQNQKVTLHVKAKPDAGPNDCRSLTLALTLPSTTGHGPEVLRIESANILPPVPKGSESPKSGQFLPVPPPDEKPDVSLDTPKNPRACAIPVFRNGATVVLVATRACTVEIR
jgi:hypothetical protein